MRLVHFGDILTSLNVLKVFTFVVEAFTQVVEFRYVYYQQKLPLN
jgi:hypothetical protein